MRTTDYDALAASAPLNRDAAIARDGGGATYAPKLNLPPGAIHSDLPLPTRPVSAAMLANPEFVDLSGQRFGRFTVLGLYVEPAGDRARWVVRCDCGRYETRTAKKLRCWEARPGGGQCHECLHLEELRAQAKLIAKGKAKPCDWVLQDRRRESRFSNAKNEVVKAALAWDASASDDDARALSAACKAYRELVAETRSAAA